MWVWPLLIVIGLGLLGYIAFRQSVAAARHQKQHGGSSTIGSPAGRSTSTTTVRSRSTRT